MLGNKIVKREHHCHEEAQDVPMAWVVEAELRSRGWGQDSWGHDAFVQGGLRHGDRSSMRAPKSSRHLFISLWNMRSLRTEPH